jgi:hypothetical protein
VSAKANIARDVMLAFGGAFALLAAAYVAFYYLIVRPMVEPTPGGPADACMNMAVEASRPGVEIGCHAYGEFAYSGPDAAFHFLVELADPGTDGGPGHRTSVEGFVVPYEGPPRDAWTCTNDKRTLSLVLSVTDAGAEGIRPVFDRMCAALRRR